MILQKYEVFFSPQSTVHSPQSGKLLDCKTGGLWTVDCGLRTVDCGLWTAGLFTTVQNQLPVKPNHLPVLFDANAFVEAMVAAQVFFFYPDRQEPVYVLTDRLVVPAISGADH